MRSPLSDRWLLCALLLLNALLKFSWLGVNELSGDEPFTVFWSQQPLSDLFTMLRTENNPPLFFLLVKAWSCCGQLDETWLRIPSAIFSTLTIWPLFLLARALGDRMIALITCLLFTLNNHQFAFAHETRAYSLLLLLAVLSFWAVVRAARTPDASGWRAGALMGLVFSILVYTHFFGWLVIALLGLCVVAVDELRPAWRSFVFACALAIVAYSPYALIFLHRAGESIAQGTWVKPHGPEEIWHMVRRWSNQPVVTILLIASMIIALVREGIKSVLVRLSMLWWLVPLLGLWAVQWSVPAYVDRYLLFASPGFYLLAGHGLARAISAERLRWILPAAGVLAMAFTFTPWMDNGQHPSLTAVQVRKWQGSPNDPPVLIYPFWYKLTFQWAMDREHFARPPWHDPWSHRWNEDGHDLEDPTVPGIVVVSALASNDPEWTEAMAAWKAHYPKVEVSEPDAGVRVMWFHH